MGANHGDCAAQAYNGSLGSPQQGPGGASGQGSKGEAPSEAETLLAFGRSMEAANLPISEI